MPDQDLNEHLTVRLAAAAGVPLAHTELTYAQIRDRAVKERTLVERFAHACVQRPRSG